MFQSALGVSALVGGFLAFFSFPLVLWLSIVPQIICIFLALKIIEPKGIEEGKANIYTHLKDSIKNFIKNPKLRLLSISSIWAYAIGEAAWLFRSAFFYSIWPVWAVGVLQLLANAGAALGFFAAGKTISKFGATKILFVGSFFSNLLNIFALTFVNIFSPIFMVLTSPFYGLSQTAKAKLFQKEFSDKQRATMGSLNSFAGSIFFCTRCLSTGIFR